MSKNKNFEGLIFDEIIDSHLLSTSTNLINGEIDSEKIEKVMKWLIYENLNSDQNKTLTLYINSNGGSLYDAFALIDLMKNSAHTIRTIGIGSVMSSAFLIFSAGTKGERFISKNASILSHQYSDELGQLKHHDIKSFAKEAEYSNERMINLLKECSGLDVNTIKKRLLPPTDVWLKPEELINLGIADHIF